MRCDSDEHYKPRKKILRQFLTVTGTGTTVNANDLEAKLKKNKYEGLVTGKVVEVCQSTGCWLKLEKADGSTLMVKAKDHGFAVPKELVGKTVIAEGKASVKVNSERLSTNITIERQSKREIAVSDSAPGGKRKVSQKEIHFTATGVKVIE